MALPRGETYRGFIISRSSVSYGPSTDWQWVHEDYDPTPLHADDGPSDNRCGHAGSVAECKREIDDWHEENS